MAAYCGAIGNVNVLDFVSTDLFDESQENPHLLRQQQPQHPSSPPAPRCSSPPRSPLRSPGNQSVRFAELPLDDGFNAAGAMRTSMAASPIKPTLVAPSAPATTTTWIPVNSPVKRQGGSVLLPPPMTTIPIGQHGAPPSLLNLVSSNNGIPATASLAVPPAPPVMTPAPVRPSITISLPYELLHRQTSGDSMASTMTTSTLDQEALGGMDESDLQRLLYELARLGITQQQQQQLQQHPPYQQFQQQHVPQQQPYHYPAVPLSSPNQYHHPETVDAPPPTSPAMATATYNTGSVWLGSSPKPERAGSSASQQSGTASLAFRSILKRESRRISRRQSGKKRYSSAPSSPTNSVGRAHEGDSGYVSADGEDDGGYGSQPESPTSRGSVTFTTMKNLLRGGGSLGRTVRRETLGRRPTCMGHELTISSRLKRRQKFQRPTILTDAYHRVSDMKLGTSPMKVKIKHLAFPQTWGHKSEELLHETEADPGMPSPKGQLRRGSLITLETLDKIGTRHACPVHLIEEPAPDYSGVEPRVDSWNNYHKPKKILRRPSTWLLGATATSTPNGLDA